MGTSKRRAVSVISFVFALSLSLFSFRVTSPALASAPTNPKCLAEIIKIINDSDGLVPECITSEDITLLVSSDGPEVDAVIQKIYDAATPFELPLCDEFEEPAAIDFSSESSYGYYRYDCETGIESYVDGSEFNHPAD